jgi:hypothetical protein
LCGAIIHGWHNPKTIATGFADPSYTDYHTRYVSR